MGTDTLINFKVPHCCDDCSFLLLLYVLATCRVYLRDRSAVTAMCGSWLLACLTSQKRASVSQGRICSNNFTCCHTETEVADQTFYLNQSQYTDTGPTSPSADPIMQGAWQGSHWSANFLSHWYDTTRKKSRHKQDSNPGSCVPEADALTTRPTRRCVW